MSAIAVEFVSGGIVLAADGVCYDGDGDIRGFISKLIPIVEMQCVMGWTGIADFGWALRHEMGDGFRDFDDLVDGLAETCEAVHAEMMERDGIAEDAPSDMRDVSIVIAGWSPRNERYEGYRILSYAKGSLNIGTGEHSVIEPWELRPLPEVWCSHRPNESALSICHLEDGDTVPDGRWAPLLVCACRASSGTMLHEVTGEPQTYNCGGFLQLAIVDGNGIRSWIAHRWLEDEIGGPVDPSRGDAVPAGALLTVS